MKIAPSHFDEFFQEEIDYPSIGCLINILPPGEKWCFVPVTFLDGFVNHVEEWIDAAVIVRYSPWHETEKRVNQWNGGITQGSDGKLIDYFEDDILLIGCTAMPIPGGRGVQHLFTFFWYDCDVSDCQIGRFLYMPDRHIPHDRKAIDHVRKLFRSFVQEESFRLSASYSSNDGLDCNKSGKGAFLLDCKKLKMLFLKGL